MKLARYTHGGLTSIGVVFDGLVVPLSWLDPNAPTSLRLVLAAGPRYLRQLERTLADDRSGVPLQAVHLLAPIPDAPKYLAIGLNYRDRVEEAARAGRALCESQRWSNKNVNCISGPRDVICKPRISNQLDCGAELGVVIGRRCRQVSVEQAREAVGGYLVCNDVTTRDWPRNGADATLGKSFDTFGPTGPWITTSDEIDDPHALDVKLWVNGELRQSTNTAAMIDDVWQQIHELSQVMTLEPGDLVATGTGANLGSPPGKFLEVGDVVTVEIEGLGRIENIVKAESA